MYNTNKGYIGSSRSVRSQNDIDSYIVPISLVNKEMIDNCIYDCQIEVNNKINVSLVKYMLKSGYLESWHHTSSFFNETNHYNLESCLIDYDANYQKYLEFKKNEEPKKKDFN